MKVFMRKFVFLVLSCLMLFVCVGGADVRADEVDDVKVYTQKLVDEAIVKIFNKNLSAKDRVVPFKSVVMENFDFDYIAKFVLGVYARGVSDSELSKFANVFAELNIYSYIKKFDAYNDSDIDVVGVKPGKKAGQFFVESKVKAADVGAKEYNVDWRIMRVGNGYKVIDVIVEGVSMALSYKNEYAAILKASADAGKNPVNDLIEKIEAKVISLKLK